MLAKVNRITRGADYKLTVRRGRRGRTSHLIAYARRNSDHETVRFGFIVGKVVGPATRRNLVRRRMKAVCRELIGGVGSSTDVVLRALPGSADLCWDSLQEEIRCAVERAVR